MIQKKLFTTISHIDLTKIIQIIQINKQINKQSVYDYYLCVVCVVCGSNWMVPMVLYRFQGEYVHEYVHFCHFHSFLSMDQCKRMLVILNNFILITF